MDNLSLNAAVLWTGGKDSSLALYEAQLLGHAVKGLVTFVPKGHGFLAHPVSLMKYQAEALGLPHHTVEIDEPYRQSYEKAIESLRDEHGIGTLITGDIAEVDGHPNWIRECSKHSGVGVVTPLWGLDRDEIISRLLTYKFKVIFSCVKKPWFTIDWVGKELNEASLASMAAIRKESGLDVCGEQGEYHTMVIDGPPFKKSIQIIDYSRQEDGYLMYIKIQKAALQGK